MVAGTPRQPAGDGAIPVGAVLFNVAATSLPAIVHILIDQMIYEGQIKPQDRDDILRTLLLEHKYGWGRWPQRGGTPSVQAGSGPSESRWSLARGGKAPPWFGFASQPSLGVPAIPPELGLSYGVLGGGCQVAPAHLMPPLLLL